MKKGIRGLSGRMATAAFAALWLSSTTMWAQTIAYDAPAQAGNQNWTGNLGLDFNVNAPIVVSALGAFDSNGAGFVTPIQVAIYNRTTAALVAGPLSFTGTNGTLVNGDRFQTLPTPVTLPPGNYSIVAVGFSSANLNGNSLLSPFTASAENGLGSVSFVGTGRYDANTSLDFPTIVPSGTPSNVFLAGTFKFGPPPAGPADTFIAAPDVQADTYPEAVVVDKFNTAHASLAIANFGGGDVSVLRGNGNGAFGPPTNYLVGNNPKSIAVGDFRGIGTSDLAVANSSDNSVSILLGTGGGGFAAAVRYPAGTSPYGVAVGDFRNKNKLDLVVVNENSSVSVLLGNGDGTFQPPTPYVDPLLAPSSVAVADFNNDGNLDIAVANAALGTVSVLLGKGDGTFKAPISTAIGTSTRPLFIAVGKFKESSGNTDVAVTDMSGGNVFVLWGKGNGHFDLQPPYAVQALPTSLAVGDLNGDGHLDLLAGNLYGFSTSVLVGDGKGNFQNAVSYSTPTMWEPTSVALGVFDESSNRTDAAVADFFGPVNILLGEELSIATSSGDAQIAATSAAFPKPVVAVVTPAQSGVPVTFTVLAGGGGASATFPGSLNSVTVLTDASGKATSPKFTANTLAGTFHISATVGYAASSNPAGTTKFTETN